MTRPSDLLDGRRDAGRGYRDTPIPTLIPRLKKPRQLAGIIRSQGVLGNDVSGAACLAEENPRLARLGAVDHFHPSNAFIPTFNNESEPIIRQRHIKVTGEAPTRTMCKSSNPK